MRNCHTVFALLIMELCRREGENLKKYFFFGSFTQKENQKRNSKKKIKVCFVSLIMNISQRFNHSSSSISALLLFPLASSSTAEDNVDDSEVNADADVCGSCCSLSGERDLFAATVEGILFS